MDRRKFLKGALGTGAVASTGALGGLLGGMSSAQASHNGETNPVLICIFQRGGCDGLNTVVPYGDANYRALRPTIAIDAPNAANPLASIALNDTTHPNFFGLNPNMSSMMPIWNAGDMAILPTVQYPGSSHSHFSGEEFIETGRPFQTFPGGWLYQHLAAQNKTGGLEGLGFGSSLSKSLRGDVVVQSVTFLQNAGFRYSDTAQLLTDNVLPLYQGSVATDPANDRLVRTTGEIMFNNIAALNAIDTANYTPAPGANYPATTYGRQMREIAQLIKEPGIPLEIATVNIGGYDTHSNQGNAGPNGRHSNRIREFAEGISALYTDLGTEMNRVIILTMTEFGRTLVENGSNGTDHGDASSWFVVGQGVNRGIHGAWTGLPTRAEISDRSRRRYLDYTLDYRDVYGQILTRHLGHTQAQVETMLNGGTYAYNPTAVSLFA